MFWDEVVVTLSEYASGEQCTVNVAETEQIFPWLQLIWLITQIKLIRGTNYSKTLIYPFLFLSTVKVHHVSKSEVIYCSGTPLFVNHY